MNKLVYLEVAMNYKVTKIGLLNFWYFDDEVFNFCDGKLLLRGGNGNGKSVTMQSFIPLILDGNKMPSRLDPFGTKEKKIEDYLLGPSDGYQKDDSTGYLYMETYNASLHKYITIGMGLRARKGRGTDFWGFALKDGRRMGIDFNLYKDYGQKVLLTKNELRARLTDNNFYTESAKEYKQEVNNLLFGFSEIESYDEFINVLLQLRSSKLSKEYTPIKLMSILTSVLQPLTEDDIRPLSEAIEDYNKTKEKIEMFEKQIKSLNSLLKTFQNYNEIIIYNKALLVDNENKNILSISNNIDEINNKNIALNNKLLEYNNKIVSLEEEQITNKSKLDVIDDKDLKKYGNDLDSINNDIKLLNDRLKSIKTKLDEELDREKDYEYKIKDINNYIEKSEDTFRSINEDISYLLDELKLYDLKNATILSEDINFEYLFNRLNSYKKKINSIKNKLEEQEKVLLEINRLEEETLDIKNKYNIEEKDLNKEENVLSQKIDEFKDNVNVLNYNNKICKLNDDERKELFSFIDNYNNQNYLQAKSLYEKICRNYEIDLINSNNNIKNKLNIEKDSYNILLDELKSLKENDELEFENTEEKIENTRYLEKNNIPYRYLYKVIDFKENISLEDKNKIEQLLISMNILNALIIPNKYLDKVHGINSVFLRKSSFKQNNLLKYINIIEKDNELKKEIEDILKSISIDIEENIFINPEKYQLDFIMSYSNNNYTSKYIGIINRIEAKKKKIKEKEKDIETKLSIINNYQNIITSYNEKIDIVKTEILSFPSNLELENILSNINNKKITMNLLNDNLITITNKLSTLSIKQKDITLEINNIRDNISIPLNLPSFKEACISIDVLSNNLYQLKDCYKDIVSKNEIKKTYEISFQTSKDNIDSYNEELLDNNRTLTSLQTKKETIEAYLNNPEMKSKIEEIKRLTARENEIPKLLIEYNSEKTKIELQIDGLNEKLSLLHENLVLSSLKLELYKISLDKEYHLGYVYKDNSIDVQKIIKELDSRKNNDKNRAIENLFSALNNCRFDLLEYRLNNKIIFNDEEALITKYSENGLDNYTVTQIVNDFARQDLTTIYQGKVLNVYELLNCLNEAVTESQRYISTQERHLFEDILLKTVGGKIRNRIESSKEWVSKINTIMKNTQTNSNLSFQLEWKSKEAYSEDELDTKEIVRLLKLPAGTLVEADSEKLVNHFRSQIQKEIELDDKNKDNYIYIISKVLDYRNWFEFKLYYRKKDSEKKELTNKAFFVFSGGERAKCMYIPLFASVYAKLLSANENALRIVALDEAFAGVDNDNITEMFDILAQLNLDYILTSQALWGDYSSIKELSICELIKDEYHKAVAVRRYRWNGHAKEILDKDYDYDNK